MDDITVSENVTKRAASNMQLVFDEIHTQSDKRLH